MYQRFGKRALDLMLVVPALAVASPILLIVGTLVRLKLGSPVLFRQRRLGLHGRVFTLVKFRTMTDERDELGQLRPDAERLTPIGRFLRSTSLDELPELVNVVKGDLSLVGPRPLFARYLDRYTPEQMHRHDVRPGITGLAQIGGRNALSWEQKFALDLQYVRSVSLWLDLKIIGQTLLMVVRRQGISQQDHATAEEFWGTVD